MLIKIIKTLGRICILAGTISTASAAVSGGYFGLMAGQSNLNGQNQTVTIFPGVTEEVKPEGSGVGGRLFMGYGMNKYAAIEGGFTYYSSMTYKTTIFTNNVKTRAASFDVLGKGMIPLANTGFGAFAKLGGAYFRAKTNGKVEGVEIPGSSTSVFRPEVALGVSYDLTQTWVMDLSYTSLRYSTSQIKNPSLIALGFSYHLGDEICGQFLC